jgi:hypothetical protein
MVATADEIGTNDYTLTYPDGTVVEFTPKLSSIHDRYSNTISVARNGSGDPTSVTDTRGVTATITLWPGTGRFESIALADGRTWTYKYDTNANLVEVDGPVTTQFPSGIKLYFGYSSGSGTAALNHNMTSATDGRGNAWMTATYDGSDRVSTQTVGGSNSFTFTYATPSTYKTTVVDRAGNSRVHEFSATTNAKMSLVEQTNRNVRSGEGDYTTLFATDADALSRA